MARFEQGPIERASVEAVFALGITMQAPCVSINIKRSIAALKHIRGL